MTAANTLSQLIIHIHFCCVWFLEIVKLYINTNKYEKNEHETMIEIICDTTQSKIETFKNVRDILPDFQLVGFFIITDMLLRKEIQTSDTKLDDRRMSKDFFDMIIKTEFTI